ncbi:hypothetical protein NC796_04900 [Aliifodinibius sp. S!AR15-10]|uniref:hypothetical protein n=1 Tax=Aliifodinibius sp. S!AR15-10 TaxID=2950437 RepID=UPI00286489B6|nr:hypothetical protein [Aliifodinibius sp. S!AR15-10]MDR8390469.1 hypothetical protein [Aliifodinibius sp. S!AR15-10]
MPKLKQIYRFLAATVLIAVMANVALPSALATVQYICNAEYMELSGSSDFGECCSSSSADTGVHHATDLKEEFCVTEQVCEQELTTVFSETHVILPEVPQLFATLTTTGSSLLSLLTNTFTPLTLNSAVPISEPPLFLLNSVFLN